MTPLAVFCQGETEYLERSPTIAVAASIAPYSNRRNITVPGDRGPERSVRRRVLEPVERGSRRLFPERCSWTGTRCAACPAPWPWRTQHVCRADGTDCEADQQRHRGGHLPATGLPHHHATLRLRRSPKHTAAMHIRRRISAIFKDLSGGQMLRSTFDYTHRLLDWDPRTET